MIGIYKITCLITNFTYVGKSISLLKREKDYMELKNNTKNQPKIYKSLITYGSINHKFEIIEECLEEQLDIREVYYKQMELDKVGGDLDKVLFYYLYDNISGKKGPRTDITKLKISKAHKGRKFSQSWKELISKRKKGFKYSEISKKIMSEKALGKNKIFRKRNLPINQYDISNNFIKQWKNSKEILNYYKMMSRSSLQKVCKGERNNLYKGYIWKYYE